METGRIFIRTADKDIQLAVCSSTQCLKADSSDLAFIIVKLVDKDGNENLQEKRKIVIRLEGAGILQGFGSADPCCVGSYQDTEWETYDGYCMAVIRSGKESEIVKVNFSAEGCAEQSIEIQIKE